MFDYVNFKMDCPECGAKVQGFQSKDLGCDMVMVEPDALMNFYSACYKCKAWIEFYRPRPNNPPPSETSLTTEQVQAMGFEMEVRKPRPAAGHESKEGK